MQDNKDLEKDSVETQQTPETTAVENQPEKPIATLLSSISYTNQEDYEKFLAGLTTEHAVIVLISAATHCQGKGIFTLDEAELIAKAIKTLSKPQAANTEKP